MTRPGRRAAAALCLVSTFLVPTGHGAAAGVQVERDSQRSTELPAAVRLGLSTPSYVLPVGGDPAVLVPFRAPDTPYGPGHRGVDLALAVGGEVRAAGVGVVFRAGDVAGRGTVSIDHADGLRTTYEPVSGIVHAGQHVVAGQVIGTLEPGHGPCAPASCLHWGARLADGEYLDPMGLLHGLQVRLLPWDQARG